MLRDIYCWWKHLAYRKVGILKLFTNAYFKWTGKNLPHRYDSRLFLLKLNFQSVTSICLFTLAWYFGMKQWRKYVLWNNSTKSFHTIRSLSYVIGNLEAYFKCIPFKDRDLIQEIIRHIFSRFYSFTVVTEKNEKNKMFSRDLLTWWNR